jgi:outer membrane protein TolC
MIIPTNTFVDVDSHALDLDAPLEQRYTIAFASRADLRISEAQRNIDDLVVVQTRNARLPQLDLVGSIGADDAESGSEGIWLGDTDTEDHYWSVGLRASIPLGNRTARGNYARARLLRERSEHEFELLRTAIMQDIREALRSVKMTAVLVDNGKKSVVLEEARFRAEQERQKFGDVTPFHVLQVQDNLVAEQTRLVIAKSELAAAAANLKRAEGVLLVELGFPLPWEPVPLED